MLLGRDDIYREQKENLGQIINISSSILQYIKRDSI